MTSRPQRRVTTHVRGTPVCDSPRSPREASSTRLFVSPLGTSSLHGVASSHRRHPHSWSSSLGTQARTLHRGDERRCSVHCT